MALGLLAWLGVMAPGCATLERPSGMASDGLEKKKKNGGLVDVIILV